MVPKREPISKSTVMHLVSPRAKELTRLGVKSLYLIGSVARNEAGPDSDVDFLVDIEAPRTYDRYTDIKFFIEDILGFGIDLVMVTALGREMKDEVERDALLVA